MTEHQPFDPIQQSPPAGATSRDFGAYTARDSAPRTARDVRALTSRDDVPNAHGVGTEPPPDHQGYLPPTPVGSAIRLPDYLERDYDVVEDLESGGEANVAVIRQRGTGARKVVKIYHRGITLPQEFVDKLATAEDRHVLAVERSVYTGWGHPRVIELMDYLPDGSLEALLSRSGGRVPDMARQILVEMTDALDYIHHTLNLVHRDVKPANILIRTLEPLDLVLADLGLAADLAASRRSRRGTTGGVKGTLVYQSPETLNLSDAGAPRDWWALGMTLCEVITGQHPFKDGRGRTLHDENAIRHAITMGAIDLSMVTDSRWNLLCRGLLTHQPQDRWGARQVRAWLSGDSPAVVTRRPHRAEGRAVPPFRFAGQRFTDPVALASHLATNWDDAVALFTSTSECDVLRTWIRNDVGDTTIETNLLAPIGGSSAVVDARILHFVAHYRGGDVVYRGSPITARTLASRYLKAGKSWEEDSLLSRLKPEVIAAIVEAQFDESAGPQGQSAEYYAMRRLSRGAGEVDRKIQAYAADIVRAVTGAIGGVDVGIDVRDAMPDRVARARAMARAALLSPVAHRQVGDELGRLAAGVPEWFAQLRAQARHGGGSGTASPSADADAAQVGATALAVSIGDLARQYEQARVNAEAAAERRRREAEAAEQQRQREAAAAAAEAARRDEHRDRIATTALGAGTGVVCFAALLGHGWLLQNVHTRDGWPSTWAYWFLHWPSAAIQHNALLAGVIASIFISILIGAVAALREVRTPMVMCLIVFCGLSILPTIGALLCFALLIVVVVGFLVGLGAILIGAISG